MQTLSAKTCLGLPALHPPRRGPKSSSKGQTTGLVPRLQRTWTLRSNPTPSGTATAALPFPFMEISVSVLDTVDLLRSSIEEEVVFQATLGVPAHHALACRIEAYDTPFSRAPDLAAAPEHLSEQDKQFAACLASPAEVEEAHEVNLGRTAPASFLQRSAPSLRFASGVLSVSLSLRQRSTDLGDREGEGERENEDDLPAVPAHTHTLSAAGSLEPADESHMLRHHSGISFTGRSSSGGTTAAGNSSAASADALGPAGSSGVSSSSGLHRPSRFAAACLAIPEDAQDFGTVPPAAAAAAVPAAAAASRGSLEQQQSMQPTGLLRVQSFTAHGRQSSEVPLTTKIANKGVAALLGVGYMMLHTLDALRESRAGPAKNFYQYQVEGFAGRQQPQVQAVAWPLAPCGVRS